MLRAAWVGVRAGDCIWHGGVLCGVRQLMSTTVLLTTYGCLEGMVANRDTQHCFETDGEGEVSYDAQLVMVGNVRELGNGKDHVAGGELLVVYAAESAMASGGEAAVTLQPDHPFKTYIPNTGITDRSCVTSAHETLPWGSHYRGLVAAPGHAWVAFALEHDPQVQEAATRAQAVAGLQDHGDSDATDDGNIPMLDTCSDGSMLAKGVEGAVAALVRVFETDVSATVRLASIDVALSSGRSEWTGLVMVLCILREVRASVVLRLGNLQVVNIFNDGEWRFRRNWLRRNDRDMAMLAWALDRERRERGYGELTALHQLEHAEKRKNRSEFDVHERYNDIAGGLTHEINGRVPVYASFSRDHAPHTALWHEPLEEENVGGAAVHEVACDSYKHITPASQRRLSISRLRERDGPLLATFSRGAIGRAKSDRVSPLTTKIIHDNLPTDARLELWAGAESGSVTCACGEPLKWSNRAEVGRLQWHMLRCTLPHETKVRREWHSAVRRTLESFTDNSRVINAAMACWSTSERGVINTTAVEDELSGWKAPSTRLVGNDGKWEFTDGIPPHL